jgi:hypothetical protein
MTQDTALQAFDRNLPVLNRPTGNLYKLASAPGTETSKATPPQFLLCEQSTAFTDRADKVLKSDRIRNGPRKDNLAPTDLGAAFLLSSESDVVEAFAIFALAEIYEILNSLWPNRWCRRAEPTNASLSARGSAVEKVRYDLIFHEIDDNGQPGDTIAVIEYKKAGMIRYADFSRALLPEKPTKEEGQAA